MLAELGYHCRQADGAEAALKILEDGEPVDLLFTDVIMPGAMKTPDFVRRALEIRPGMVVLYTSGYTENAIVHHGRLDEGVSLLSKPYTKADLARKVAASLLAGRETVLLVEDDALVRAAAAEMLGELGFAVLEAGDGPAALAVLESGARIDVLFTDIGLPGLRGDELARRARILRPDLRIVLASGYSEREAVEGVDGVQTLDKPYDSAALARVLGR
jgi:CheY-like chemotaxis protein